MNSNTIKIKKKGINSNSLRLIGFAVRLNSEINWIVERGTREVMIGGYSIAGNFDAA